MSWVMYSATESPSSRPTRFTFWTKAAHSTAAMFFPVPTYFCMASSTSRSVTSSSTTCTWGKRRRTSLARVPRVMMISFPAATCSSTRAMIGFV